MVTTRDIGNNIGQCKFSAIYKTLLYSYHYWLYIFTSNEHVMLVKQLHQHRQPAFLSQDYVSIVRKMLSIQTFKQVSIFFFFFVQDTSVLDALSYQTPFCQVANQLLSLTRQKKEINYRCFAEKFNFYCCTYKICLQCLGPRVRVTPPPSLYCISIFVKVVFI